MWERVKVFFKYFNPLGSIQTKVRRRELSDDLPLLHDLDMGQDKYLKKYRKCVWIMHSRILGVYEMYQIL